MFLFTNSLDLDVITKVTHKRASLAQGALRLTRTLTVSDLILIVIYAYLSDMDTVANPNRTRTLTEP